MSGGSSQGRGDWGSRLAFFPAPENLPENFREKIFRNFQTDLPEIFSRNFLEFSSGNFSRTLFEFIFRKFPSDFLKFSGIF
jgi:hypothetical protein